MMDLKKGLTAPLFVPRDFLRLDQLPTLGQSCYLFLKFTNENKGGGKSDNKAKTRPDKLNSFAASWTGNENLVKGRK